MVRKPREIGVGLWANLSSCAWSPNWRCCPGAVHVYPSTGRPHYLKRAGFERGVYEGWLLRIRKLWLKNA